MDSRRIADLRTFFLDRLTRDTMPFWTAHGVDHSHGGFATYVDRRGDRLSTDKSGWVQGRMTWLMARLYNELEPRPEWLALAKHGAEFLQAHCFDTDGRMFFTLARDGSPLRKRRYLFTEAFGAIGLAEYARASGDRRALEVARRTMELFEELDARGLDPKYLSASPRVRSHSMSMIRIATYQVLQEADPERDYAGRIDHAIESVFRYFAKPEKQALFETVGTEGEVLDTPLGRSLCPGHAIETAWFIMEEARKREDRTLLQRALPILDWSLERGWDPEHGGLLYFVDFDGRQAPQLEWDMKLWWPHNEALIATLLAHLMTGDDGYLAWFERIHAWCEAHFPDPEYGEWIGYLHRDGTVAMDFKGNHWKGPFHLPRQQLYCYRYLRDLGS